MEFGETAAILGLAMFVAGYICGHMVARAIGEDELEEAKITSRRARRILLDLERRVAEREELAKRIKNGVPQAWRDHAAPGGSR